MKIPTPVDEFPDSEWYTKVRKILDSRTSINSETGCWEFGDGDRYGQIIIDHVAHYVHRLSAMMFLGFRPEDSQLWVLHKCKTRNCWNPGHLYLGTATDNSRDRSDAGTANNQNIYTTHCPQGHEYNEENTRQYKGRRYCKICQSIKMKEYNEKKKLLKFGKAG